MKALTLHRPWPWAIFHAPTLQAKRVENRTWEPPPALLGQRIAIHAGKSFDLAAAEEIRAVFGIDVPLAEAHPLGIIGVATVIGYVVGRDGNPQAGGSLTWMKSLTLEAQRTGIRAAQSPWCSGPIGWLLDDVRALPESIACRGAQGLWTVPADVEARVREQLEQPR